MQLFPSSTFLSRLWSISCTIWLTDMTKYVLETKYGEEVSYRSTTKSNSLRRRNLKYPIRTFLSHPLCSLHIGHLKLRFIWISIDCYHEGNTELACASSFNRLNAIHNPYLRLTSFVFTNSVLSDTNNIVLGDRNYVKINFPNDFLVCRPNDNKI